MPRKSTLSNHEAKASPPKAKTSAPRAKALPAKAKTSQPKAEFKALRAQLAEALRSKAEAEETLRAILQGEVDAILVERPAGPHAYTLGGADHIYQILVESMNEGALAVDPAGLILYANSRLAEILGRPLKSLLGTALPALVAPEDARSFDTLWQAYQQGQPARGEVQLVTQDGARLPAQLAIRPFRYDHLAGAGIVVSDLTFQKRAEAVLYGGQARLEAQVTIATEELQMINEELQQRSAELSHTVQALTAKDEQLSKLTRLYVALSRVNEAIVRTHQVQTLFQAVCQIVADGGFALVWIGQVNEKRVVPVAWSGPAADYLPMITVEVQGPLGQGPTGTCIRENHPVVNEDFAVNPKMLPWREPAHQFGIRASAAFPLRCEGRVVGALTLYSAEPKAFDPEQVDLLHALAADLSYALEAMSQDQLRQQAEQALRESEEKARKLVKYAPAMIYEMDIRGTHFISVNDAMCALSGYTRDELLATKPMDLLDDEQSKAHFRDRIRGKLAGGEVDAAIEYKVRTKDGRRLIMALRTESFTYQNAEPAHVLVIAHDITERKQAEQVIQDQNEQLQAQNEELAAQREELQAQNEELNVQRLQLQAQNEELAGAQLAAETQQQRLAAVMEALPVGAAITDAAGGHVQANAAFEQIWGAPRPSPQSVADYAPFQAWWVETGRPVAPHEWASAQAVEKGQTVAGQVLEIQRFDGGRAFVINGAAPVRDAQGHIIGSAVAIQDITALIKAEERLAYQARLLAHVHDAIIGMDERFRITYWNPTAQEMYGWTEAETLGLTTADLFQSRPLGPNWAEATQLVRQTDYFEGEVYHQRKDGQVILVHTRSAAIRDQQGGFKGVVTSIRDITERRRLEDEVRRARDELEVRVGERTEQLEAANAVLEEEIEERKQAEAQVRENARRSQALAEISQVLAEAKFDDQAAIDGVTRYAAKLFNDACLVSLLSADGQWLAIEALHHPDAAREAELNQHLPPLPAQFEAGPIARHLIASDQPLVVPVIRSAPGLEWLPPEYRLAAEQVGLQSLLAVPLHAQGQVMGHLIVLRLRPAAPYQETDQLTAQNLADRLALAIANARLYRDLESALAQEQAMHQQLAQAEKLGALGRMVGSVAHELNNPLQTITNCLYLTRGDLSADSPIHTYLEMANSETERLVRLVAQLRELYRPHADPPEIYDLAQLLQSVHSLMAPQLQSGRVQWQQPADLPGGSVCIVPDRLKQVLINIVVNAIEAMQPAGGQLRVDMVPSADGRQVGVRFEDTGPGISPEHLSRLFEPFFTTKSQGLGLGLAICYEIAQQHGGQITAESQPGQGAVFTLWLPLAQPAGGENAPETSGDPRDAAD